jgi:hypothetical protein
VTIFSVIQIFFVADFIALQLRCNFFLLVTCYKFKVTDVSDTETPYLRVYKPHQILPV